MHTDGTCLRFLEPAACRIHRGALGALHVEVDGEGDYGGIFAAQAFPVASPQAWIALIQSGEERDREIGVIRDLAAFPPSQAELVQEALRRRYFVHIIFRIREIRAEYGLLAFHVETDKGPVRFHLRATQDRATEYGARGRVLIDLDDNRYLIPDLEKLSPGEQVSFQRHIYW